MSCHVKPLTTSRSFLRGCPLPPALPSSPVGLWAPARTWSLHSFLSLGSLTSGALHSLLGRLQPSSTGCVFSNSGSHSSGGPRSEIRVSQGCASSESSRGASLLPRPASSPQCPVWWPHRPTPASVLTRLPLHVFSDSYEDTCRWIEDPPRSSRIISRS